MFAVEGLVIYYALFSFFAGLADVETPLKGGVETLVIFAAALIAYSEYQRVSKGDQTWESKKTELLHCVKRDLSAVLLYLFLGMAVSKYGAFFFGAAVVAFVFFVWRKRLCKNRGW